MISPPGVTVKVMNTQLTIMVRITKALNNLHYVKKLMLLYFKEFYFLRTDNIYCCCCCVVVLRRR